MYWRLTSVPHFIAKLYNSSAVSIDYWYFGIKGIKEIYHAIECEYIIKFIAIKVLWSYGSIENLFKPFHKRFKSISSIKVTQPLRKKKPQSSILDFCLDVAENKLDSLFLKSLMIEKLLDFTWVKVA